MALASNIAGAGEQAPPTFPSTVELITVDVVVADRNGRPVPGLKRDDFVLKEDGAVQEIVGFEAFDSEAAPPAEPRPPTAATTEGAPGAAFLLVLDDNAMLPGDAVSARRAVTAFLSRSAEAGDEVTLATTSGDLWWTARIPEGREDLTAVVDRLRGRRFLPSSDEWMSDDEAHWIADHGDDLSAGEPASGARAGLGTFFQPLAAQGPDTGLLGRSSSLQVRAQAIALDAERRVRTWALLKIVRRGLTALVGFQGRKSLLLLSPGFLDDSAGPVRELAAAAREANTVVYFVDVRGLVTLRGMASVADADMSSFASVGTVMKSSTSDSAGARRLAQDTGGFSLRNTNELGAGIDRIAAESRVYYLLAFHAPAGKPVNKWRKLRVEVKRPGLEVRARRGYRLSRAVTDARPRIDDSGSEAKTLPASVEGALDSARDAAGIPLRAKAYAFEPRAQGAVRVLVVGEFDAGGLTYEGRGAARAAHVEVTVAATDRDTGKTINAGQSAEVRAPEGSPPGWRSFSRELVLPPGVAQVRTVVRDAAAGTLGAVSERIEVPPAGALRVSTPILTDRVDRGSGGLDAPRAALGAHRVFQPDRTLYCEFEVFGAARDLFDGAPRISDEIAVLAAGEVVREARFVRIVTEREGRAVRLVTLDLHDVPDGAYELSLSVRDDIAGARVELREPFTLER